MHEIYQHFQDGIALMCVLRLFVEDPQLRPDPAMMFQYPVNRQEYVHNLQHIHHVQYKNNVPIYLQPAEFLDSYQPQFLMLQLYYLYCKFKDANPTFAPPGSPGHPRTIVFRDQGRKRLDVPL